MATLSTSCRSDAYAAAAVQASDYTACSSGITPTGRRCACRSFKAQTTVSKPPAAFKKLRISTTKLEAVFQE
ncbi:MAG: hypothetical protein LBS00_11415 [Synergistaceae bacterium]|nr:hypothetical protein [Synergistaceae bacterium]